MKATFNIIKVIILAAIIAFDAWVFFSWINVIMNNMSPDTIQNIWAWNFFSVMF